MIKNQQIRKTGKSEKVKKLKKCKNQKIKNQQKVKNQNQKSEKSDKIKKPQKWSKCHLNGQNRHFVISEPPGPAFFGFWGFQGVPRLP